jgi:hypothetical protein
MVRTVVWMLLLISHCRKEAMKTKDGEEEYAKHHSVSTVTSGHR